MVDTVWSASCGFRLRQLSSESMTLPLFSSPDARTQMEIPCDLADSIRRDGRDVRECESFDEVRHSINPRTGGTWR